MSTAKSERELLTEIRQKLDKLIGIIAIQGKSLDTQIQILTKLGLSSAEIGPLVGQRPESVRRRRSKKKRPKSKKL